MLARQVGRRGQPHNQRKSLISQAGGAGGRRFTRALCKATVLRMDVNALRLWGIAASAAVVAGALAISLQDHPAPARAATPVVERAEARAFYSVRFRGGGPIARAQALAARGRVERAGRRVRTELARQQAFQGLCFERFAAGAVVLKTCAPEPLAEQRRWLERLRAMPAVAYVNALDER